MTNSNHVEPGPWKAFKWPNDRLGRWAVTASGPGLGKPVVADQIRTQAMAELIAAAPSMLDELKDTLTMLDHLIREYGADSRYGARARSIRDTIRKLV